MCEVGKAASKLYESIKRGERDTWWDEWCPNEREVTSIYTLCWGRGDTSIGLMSLHLIEADLDNLCMRRNKFKIPFLLVRMRWSLYQNWTSRKEESNAIIISIIRAVLRWNLALVANFNTPSQLGRIPRGNPIVIMPSCHHVPSLSSLPCSALFCWTMKK